MVEETNKMKLYKVEVMDLTGRGEAVYVWASSPATAGGKIERLASFGNLHMVNVLETDYDTNLDTNL